MYLCIFLCCKQLGQQPFSFSFAPGIPNEPVTSSLILFPNTYSIQNLTQITPISQTLTLANLNLILNIVGVTHPNSTTALYPSSFTKTIPQKYHLLHTTRSPPSYLIAELYLSKGKQLKLPFSKTIYHFLSLPSRLPKPFLHEEKKKHSMGLSFGTSRSFIFNQFNVI